MTKCQLVAAAACFILATGCSGDNGASTTVRGPTFLPPPQGSELQAVLQPDFSAMGTAAAEQMRVPFEHLLNTIENNASTNEQLADAYGEMGNLLLAARELDTAEEYYVNAQILAPNDRRWSHLLGHVYRNRGPLENAVNFFEQALQLEPNSVATLVRLGDVHLAMGQPETGAEYFTRALTVQSDSAAAWFGVGRAALASDRNAEAVKALQQALTHDPGATAIHYLLAMAYRGIGNMEQAQTHLSQQGPIEPRPDDPLLSEIEGRFESALMLDFRGGEALATGNWAAAADYFERALGLSPDSPSLRHRFGTALYRMGDSRGAEEQFQQIVTDSPEYTEAHVNLATIMARSGRLQEAISQLSIALEREPGDIATRISLARTLGRNGQLKEALEQYEQTLILEPLDATATLGAAMTLGLLEHYEDTFERLTDGVRAFPNDSRFKRAMARLLAAAPDEQIRDVQRSLVLAEELLEAAQEQDQLATGETFAMALAAVGQYPVAIAVQQDVRAGASQAGLNDATDRINDNLALFQNRQPPRTPWTSGELP